MGMIDQQTEDLESLVAALEEAGRSPGADALANVAMKVAKLFGVDPDEVAILKTVPKYRSLKFVVPEKLAQVGTIPLTSSHSLAARTARDRKPELANNFSAARHATVFEAVPLGRDPGELIHKIMSAPILDGTKVQGIVQISRKGRSAAESGPDFTHKDLQTLTSLSPILDRFLKLCTVE
jgi:hypothetical protein